MNIGYAECEGTVCMRGDRAYHSECLKAKPQLRSAGTLSVRFTQQFQSIETKFAYVNRSKYVHVATQAELPSSTSRDVSNAAIFSFSSSSTFFFTGGIVFLVKMSVQRASTQTKAKRNQNPAARPEYPVGPPWCTSTLV